MVVTGFFVLCEVMSCYKTSFYHIVVTNTPDLQYPYQLGYQVTWGSNIRDYWYSFAMKTVHFLTEEEEFYVAFHF